MAAYRAADGSIGQIFSGSGYDSVHGRACGNIRRLHDTDLERRGKSNMAITQLGRNVWHLVRGIALVYRAHRLKTAIDRVQLRGDARLRRIGLDNHPVSSRELGVHQTSQLTYGREIGGLGLSQADCRLDSVAQLVDLDQHGQVVVANCIANRGNQLPIGAISPAGQNQFLHIARRQNIHSARCVQVDFCVIAKGQNLCRTQQRETTTIKLVPVRGQS